MMDHKNPLWYSLKIEDKRKLAKFYRKQLGGIFVPPTKEGKPIKLSPKIESLEEIGKLMRQKPSPRRGPGQ